MGSNLPHPSRVFIDSSVLIAASISRSGYARDLVLMGVDRLVQLAVSSFVLAETRRNLARKSPGGVTAFDAFIALDFLLCTNPPDRLVREVAHLIESKDAAIVAGALTAHCHTLATFDRRHLLSEARRIEEQWGLHVQTPGELVQRLALRPESS